MHVLSIVAVALAVSAALPSATAGDSESCTAMQCSNDYQPVCGTNGVTYQNACFFTRAKCTELQTTAKDELSIASTGACESQSATNAASAVTIAPEDAACEMACVNEYAPVCGSDGVTYTNKCHLELANCRSPTEREEGAVATISVASEGVCAIATVQPAVIDEDEQDEEPSAVTITPTDTAEEEDADGEEEPSEMTVTPELPESSCEKMCPASYEPVCGSDGNTYASECELEVVSCQSRTMGITVASVGECDEIVEDGSVEDDEGDEEEDVEDDDEILEDGSEEDEEENEEENEQDEEDEEENEEENEQDEEDEEGDEDEEEEGTESAQDDAEAAESCERMCPSDFAPVCGSDQSTYSNQCEFEVAKCRLRIATLSFTEGACADQETVRQRA